MKVLFVGVGGFGLNILRKMKDRNLFDVEFLGIDTDASALHILCKDNDIPYLQIGNGLYTRHDTSIGEKAIMESEKAIESELAKADLVVILCGMGCGMGSASWVIAKMATDLGIRTLGIITHPFGFEAENIHDIAETNEEKLLEYCEYVEVIHNEFFERKAKHGALITEILNTADEAVIKKAWDVYTHLSKEPSQT